MARKPGPTKTPKRSGRAFVAIDRILDKTVSGPLHLRMPEIAGLVAACLRVEEQRFHRHRHPYVFSSATISAAILRASSNSPGARLIAPTRA